MTISFRKLIGFVFGMAMVGAVSVATPALAQSDGTVSALVLGVESPLGDKAMGNPDAKVTVIEYASLTCPHCQNFRMTVFDAFKTKYIDTGLVYFILREFPRDLLDAAAFMLARCAPGENGYFALIDTLFAQQPAWAFVANPEPPLRNLARQLGFTDASFDACLSDQSIADSVFASLDHATQNLGVSGTPTFFINGNRYSGEMTLPMLDTAIQPLLQ